MAKQKLRIVKIGGNVIDNSTLLDSFLDDFCKLTGYKILVHGGGKIATEIATKLGIQSILVEGRRITDAQNLEVVIMVYAGLINKQIVAKLQKRACNAIGLTGADANSIQAHKRTETEIDYGFVGDVDLINAVSIKSFLRSKQVPVFCGITHNGNGQLLNTNADTIAAEISIAMSVYFEVELNYVFELKGVLKDVENKNSLISELNVHEFESLKSQGIIARGMIPKLQNCFNALNRGVNLIKIGDTSIIKETNKIYTKLTSNG